MTMVPKININKLIELMVLLLIFGCSTMQSRWKDAQSENTIQSYEEFLKQYPEGDLAYTARKRIENIHFKQAMSQNTIEAYENFLRVYPDGSNASKARSKIEAIYFKQAKLKDTIEAYEDFLNRFSKQRSSIEREIKSRIEELRRKKFATVLRSIKTVGLSVKEAWLWEILENQLEKAGYIVTYKEQDAELIAEYDEYNFAPFDPISGRVGSITRGFNLKFTLNHKHHGILFSAAIGGYKSQRDSIVLEKLKKIIPFKE